MDQLRVIGSLKDCQHITDYLKKMEEVEGYEEASSEFVKTSKGLMEKNWGK